jgi:uncharacterized protein (DUF362 family)/Pyruvate/2-oxoacid:ferredoxin oxidoreductase delta subunit
LKPRVSLVACPDYDRNHIEAALKRLLEPEGGMAAFVRPGQKVLLKPNLLAARKPEKAVTTHPELVRAVIRLVQQAGGVVTVGDSPGIGAPRTVARCSGILQVVEETGADFAPFEESVRVRLAGSAFHQLEIARDILDADLVINLPKLKTHQMMGLTCGVKNLFGAVIGLRKPRLHLQAGTDKKLFALMLLELAEHIAPVLTIADAVTGMEGNGPGGGDPVFIGALLASRSPLALDTVATALVGLGESDVWTQRLAVATRRPGSRLEEIDLQGDALEDLICRNFRPAKSTEVNFNLPPFLQKPLRRSMSALPVVKHKQCRLCGMCIGHCPPEAMRIEKGRLRIDYNRCIGCFCCQELCPEGALLTRQGLLLRLSRFLRAPNPEKK